MSLLAVVTFDLHGARPVSYSRVKRKLANLRLENQLQSKSSNQPTRLPANTFAAKFGGKWNGDPNGLRNYLRDHVVRVVSSLGLEATIFVVVGEKWAWGTQTV